MVYWDQDTDFLDCSLLSMKGTRQVVGTPQQAVHTPIQWNTVAPM